MDGISHLAPPLARPRFCPEAVLAGVAEGWKAVIHCSSAAKVQHEVPAVKKTAGNVDQPSDKTSCRFSEVSSASRTVLFGPS